MLHYEEILFSLYEIKGDAECLNRSVKNDVVQTFTSKIVEHAKAAINEVKTQMAIENLMFKKASKEIRFRKDMGEDEDEETSDN